MEDNTNTPSSDTNAAQDMSTPTEFDNKENTMNKLNQINTRQATQLAPLLDMDAVQRFLSGDKFKAGQTYMQLDFPIDTAYGTGSPGDLYIGSDYYGYVGEDALHFFYIVAERKNNSEVVSINEYLTINNKENIMNNYAMELRAMPYAKLEEEFYSVIDQGADLFNTGVNYWDDREQYEFAVEEVSARQDLIEAIMKENLNELENTMKNAPFTNCHAITKKGGKCMSNRGRKTMSIFVRGGEAVHEDIVKHDMSGWYRMELPFCSTHINTLLKGQIIKIQSIKRDIVEETKALAPKVEKEVKKMEKKGISCGKCHGYHPTAQDVRNCYKGYKKIVTHVAKKGVLCGHCKGYHPTPADVKACYGR